MKNFLLAFFVFSASLAAAQSQPVNLSNTPGRRAHGFTDENEELPARNHGTGVRVAMTWSAVQAAARGQQAPRAFEVGVFRQVPLSRALSVQGEASYYRGTTTNGLSSGLRLPALLVINPFYNVSVHVGPQLQLRTGGSAATLPALTTELPGSERAVPQAQPARRLTAGVVVGGEARVGFMRVGLRYGLPFSGLTDLPEAGQQIGQAWKTGQVQVYLGAGF